MSSNLVWHHHPVDQSVRAKQKNQQPVVIWFTGLSASGKSTLAGALEQILTTQGYHTYLLDGDNVRHGLNAGLGFSAADREENIRRVGEVAKLMTDAGLIPLTAFISPFAADRDLARNMLPEGQFIEVFVDASLDECRRRDPKGLYAKADAGQIKDFTGIDSPYEKPAAPEVHIDSDNSSVAEAVNQILAYLDDKGVLHSGYEPVQQQAS